MKFALLPFHGVYLWLHCDHPCDIQHTLCIMVLARFPGLTFQHFPTWCLCYNSIEYLCVLWLPTFTHVFPFAWNITVPDISLSDSLPKFNFMLVFPPRRHSQSSRLGLTLHGFTSFLSQNYLFTCFFIALDCTLLAGRANVLFIFVGSSLSIVSGRLRW